MEALSRKRAFLSSFEANVTYVAVVVVFVAVLKISSPWVLLVSVPLAAALSAMLYGRDEPPPPPPPDDGRDEDSWDGPRRAA